MAATCEEVLSTNMTYWETSNNTSRPPPEIGEITCPGLCSGQGTCRNGTCVCNSGFISADCSINATKGPTVTSIVNGVFCDIRNQRDCSKVRVIGSDFIDSKDLSCRAMEIEDQQVIVSHYKLRFTCQGWFRLLHESDGPHSTAKVGPSRVQLIHSCKKPVPCLRQLA